MTKPAWFTQLEHDLNASVMVPDGAIDWDRCRDRFLIALLQRLEKRSNSRHPAIVRGLLQRRLAGEDVTAELSAVTKRTGVEANPWAAAARATAATAAADAERADQLADLQAAVAASTQQPALPDGYIDGDITGPDRELLAAFYTACNSEGGTADEIHLRGIHAAIAQAASGFIVPTPVADALRRLLRWGGMPGSNGYDAEVVLGVVDWATSGMIGPLPPLPPLLARPVDLAALHDPTFSDGLTATQHRDVLRGGPDPRVPEPVTPTARELLELMPQQLRNDLDTVSRLAAHGASAGITPGLFRVSLNTGVQDYARAVLDYARATPPLPPLNLPATEQP
jgi:hypothetical protein